jgi:hypothetical protein
MNENGDL